MKKVIFTLGIAASTLASSLTQAQGVGINNDNTDPNPSAMLDVKSTNKGLLIPRMSSTQRAAITSPAKGLMVFDNQTNSFWYFNGTAWTQFLGGVDNDNQTLGLSGTNLSIVGGNSVNLSGLNTDNQTLNFSGTTLSIGRGNSVNLASLAGTDNQTLGLSGNRLVIARGNNIDLSPFLDNTDNQTLNFSGTTLSIGRGNSVNLASLAGTDNQTLGFSGTTLNIGRGNSVNLASLRDNLGNHSATTTLDMNSRDIIEVATLSGVGVPDYDKLRVWNSSSYTIGMNSAMTYGYLGDYAMTFTMNTDTDRGWIFRDISDSKGDGALSLTTDGRLTVKGRSRFQDLSGTGTRMVVANATGELSTQTVPSTRSANNGLQLSGNTVQLGGNLVRATTINVGAHPIKLNLNGTGDFDIQSNGTNKFAVIENGTAYFGGDVLWRDENTQGTILASLIDEGDDGRFTVRENGNVSIDLDANGTTVFNEQGFNRDFRVESDNSPHMFFVDANTNRIGIGNATPLYQLSIDEVTKPTAVHIRGRGMSGDPVDAAIIFDDNGASGSGYNGAGIFHLADYGSTRMEWFAGRPSSVGYSWTASFGDSYVISRKGLSGTGHDATTANPTNILVRVRNNGNMGLGTVNPAYRLQLSTNSAAKPSSSAWTVASDRRLKQNITPFSDGLSTLLAIRPVHFQYNGEAQIADTEKGIGTIAQELQTIAPYMVKEWEYEDTKGEKTTYLGVDYGAMDFVIVNAVKELNEKIETLETENKTLKTKEATADAKIKALEAKLNKIEAALEKSGLLND